MAALFNGAVAISLTVLGAFNWFLFSFFCLSVLLFFVLTWGGVLILGAIAVIWAITATVLFPILLPIFLPLLLILLFISYVRRKQDPN
ncbi:hypothetical protein [Rickettsiella massiliensis]|uniref:hypothetical protein n=1 Tax=Rickettsiella massiliensis TaxID=676517 RepID=UPI00029B28BB|nr:hypothetical protein [Rickettsiella massiliensis]